MGNLQGLTQANGTLYAAWKGVPGDDRIFYSTTKGSGSWTPGALLGGNSSSGPALTTVGGVAYAAWKGEWSDPRLFFTKLSGTTWAPQQQIPGVYSDVGPSLASHDGKLVAAWKNAFDQNVYYATYDGSTWDAPARIAGIGSSTGPSLAAFQNRVYAAWKGEGNDQGLYYASFDGSTWTSQTPIPNVGSSVGPSLAGFGSKLYAMWKGEGNDQALYYTSFDGSTWSAQTRLPNFGSSIGTSIAELNGKLYAMWKGENADDRLFTSSFDGTNWTAETTLPGNSGPDSEAMLAAPAGGDSNYVLADSKGAKLTGTTVTVIVAEDIVPDGTENYSFQINCYSPGQASGKAPFVWQQFGFRVAANELFFWVNGYREQDLPGTPMINWDSRPPRMANNTGVVALPNNVLPKGWQLTTTLVTDGNSNVTGFEFSVTQANGTVLRSPTITLESLNPSVGAANLAPILNCQAIMVGENGGATTDFSAGQGIFLFTETNSLTASVSQEESAEGSNVQYSALPDSYPNGEFYQLFGVPTA